MSTFLEGVAAVRLPCTLAVLVPAIAVVLVVGREALGALVAFGVGLIGVAWARFAGLWFASPAALGAVAVGIVMVALFIAARRVSDSNPVYVPAIAAVAGIITAWLWRPCVGQKLGDIINSAPADRFGTILPTSAYVAGVLLLAAVLVIAPTAVPRLADFRDHPRTRAVGLIVGTGIGVSIAIGLYQDAVAELLRRSVV